MDRPESQKIEEEEIEEQTLQDYTSDSDKTLPFEKRYPKTTRVRLIGTGIFEGDFSIGFIVKATANVFDILVEYDGIEFIQPYNRMNGLRVGREEVTKHCVRLDRASVNPHFNIGLEQKIEKNEGQRLRRFKRTSARKKAGKKVKLIIINLEDNSMIYDNDFDTPREARKFLRRQELSSKDTEKIKGDKLDTWTAKVFKFKKAST